MRHRRESGFTLLEMAITMSVFALLVAAGVPSFKTWIFNTRVRAVADAMQNGLRLAQTESLRRSRQVVFSMTNTANPSAGFTAVTGGQYFVIDQVPSMTDGSENATNWFIEAGPLGNANNGVTISGGPAAICFNSLGRLVNNSLPVVTNITNGPTCQAPSAPPYIVYRVAQSGADRPLNVEVFMGGQVHMCDPSKVLSSSNPDGC